MDAHPTLAEFNQCTYVFQGCFGTSRSVILAFRCAYGMHGHRFCANLCEIMRGSACGWLEHFLPLCSEGPTMFVVLLAAALGGSPFLSEENHQQAFEKFVQDFEKASEEGFV